MTRRKRKPISETGLTDHERRERMVRDLATVEWEGTLAARKLSRDQGRAAPLIAGRWCRRLIAAGLVKMHETTDRHKGRTRWFYVRHAITDEGREYLRENGA